MTFPPHEATDTVRRMTPSQLVAKLAELRALDPNQELFGANNHHYELTPSLREDEIATFETEQRVRLPDEYRRFLLEAGASGAGPVYGLAPLKPWTPDGFTQVHTRITDKTGAVVAEAGTAPRPGLARAADPSRPFPLREAWGPPAEDGSNFDFPTDANPFDGCTYLAEIGCGYCYFLVLSGDHAGEVWQDYTAGDGQIAPTGKGFLAWYDEWLNDGLAERAAETMELALKGGDEPTPEVARYIPLVEDYAARSPEWPTARLRVGIARAYEKRFAEAEAEFARVLEMSANYALEVAVARCASFWRQKKLAEVVEAAEKGLASNQYSFPKLRELHEVRVLALRLSGRFPEAIAASQERIAFDSSALVAWLDKAHVEVLAGDAAAAEATIRGAASKGGELDRGLLAGGFNALARRLEDEEDQEGEVARLRGLAEGVEQAASSLH